MKTNLALIPLCLFLLNACSSFGVLDKKLPYFKGKKIDEAISYFGYPNDERVIAGKTIYTWSTAFTHTSFTPVTTNSTGVIGGQYYSGSSQTYIPETHGLSCVLRAITDKNIVIGIEYSGNNGACYRFSNQLTNIKIDGED